MSNISPGCVIWLTGLPSSGKTTLALAAAASLQERGLPVEVLDGDELRKSLSSDLGFSAADRQEHARRVIYLAKLLARNGIIVLVPLISPYADTRRFARQQIERFIEVYVKCPVEECIKRDVKGLYAKALRGEITEFTGISDPYEEPSSPEVILETNVLSVEECLDQILRVASTAGFLPSPGQSKLVLEDLRDGSPGTRSQELPGETASVDGLFPEGISSVKLLQGRYEAELLPADFTPERIVPDFAFNILNPSGLLYRPIVDEQALASGRPKPAWPEGKPFAVCLTHDVDHVSSRSLLQHLRRTWHTLQWQRSQDDGSIIRTLGSGALVTAQSALARGADPYHCYEQWLNLESSIGARSTFFFLPDKVARPHYTDGAYRYSDVVRFDGQRCTVAEMMQEMDRRGWEIGLHASWYAFDDADELKRQKEQIEAVIGHEIASIRQHCLHHDIRVTPHAQVAAGFKYDSTLGFNDNVGFRFGTSYPWRLYDLKEERSTSLLEVPIIVQDGALLATEKGLRLDEDTAFRYVVQQAEAVKSVGGVLTLLWHPNVIARPAWWNVYVRALEYLKDQKAWFASVQEIGEWWESQSMALSLEEQHYPTLSRNK